MYNCVPSKKLDQNKNLNTLVYVCPAEWLESIRTCPLTAGMVNKISCCLQARNELNEYIYDSHFNKFK